MGAPGFCSGWPQMRAFGALEVQMMPVTLAIVVESLFLGVALAMDAMAVTLSNTLCEPDMPAGKKLAMPLLFAIF